MAASARFLAAYESAGADGKRHTQPSNAHEQQWDTTDPTTDLAARTALFPAVASAAKSLGRRDYDGVIRIAPAVPAEWDFAGSVWVRHHTRVDVQVHQGVATTVVIEAGEYATLSIRNPWPAEAVEVVDSRGAVAVTAPAHSWVKLHAQKHETYLLRPAGAPAAIFAQLTAEPASRCKALVAVQIGN